MLWDLYHYLTAPFPWYLAPMGYVRESARLARLGRRRRTAWAHHLERSRELILRTADQLSVRGKALIVGSGALADVPLDALCRQFREVTLVDIVHPRRALREVRPWGNVRLIQADVTGMARTVFDARARRASLPSADCPRLFLQDGYDFVVSVNLLSQLPLLPVCYLRATRPDISLHEREEFANRIIQRHLEWLAGFTASTCLITDFQRLERRPAGTFTKDLLFGVALPPCAETWTWQFVRRGRIGSFLDVQHRVAGFTAAPRTL